MESGEFGEIYSKLAEQGKKAEGLLEAPLAYDAVWASALGRTLSQLNSTKSVHNVSKILHPIKCIKHMKPPKKNDS